MGNTESNNNVEWLTAGGLGAVGKTKGDKMETKEKVKHAVEILKSITEAIRDLKEVPRGKHEDVYSNHHIAIVL